ncbi:MAG TPA: sigma factor-like helix-turn-helix DNA-binding protein [Kofleriaceae bacterium]
MSDAGFDAHVDRCRASGARDEHRDELHLAWRGGCGEPDAVRELDTMITSEAEAAARRVDRSPAFVDEVRQALRVRLLVGDEGRVRIHDYVGRGPLRGWIGVAALRVALNLKRATGPVSAEILTELVDDADPEMKHLKTLYRAEFKDALTATLRALPERQRALLRLSYVDGVSMVQLGRLYDVHETTAARWVKAAAAAVAEDARRRLTERLSLSPSSLDSVARMVLSNLDASISRLLRG